MYDVLTTSRTPVFISKDNKQVTHQSYSEISMNKFIVKNCEKHIKKIGDMLYIDGVKYDIGYYNVLEFYKLLKMNGIDIKFLTNNVGWSLQAICICDFDNQEIRDVEVLQLPFDLSVHNNIINKGTVSLDDTVINVLHCTDRYGINSVNFVQKHTYLSDVDLFDTKCKALIKVQTQTFMLKLNTTAFTTTKKDIASKHLKGEDN